MQGCRPMHHLDFSTVPLSTNAGVKPTWTKGFTGKTMPGKTKPKAKAKGKKPAAKAKKTKPRK